MGKQSGQSLLAFLAGLSIMFGTGVAALQLAGLGIRSWQLQDAAMAGAITLAHGVRVGNPASAPCWQAADGLLRPAAYSQAETCRAIAAHLNGLDPARTSVSVKHGLSNADGRPSLFRVAVTYHDPVTSPLLRLVIGPTYTSTSEATAASQ